MKLHEYQSKQIFSRYGIPIPKGRVAATADEAKQIAKDLGSWVVIKSQVLVGGRGKAGGIRLAKTSEEAAEFADQILAMEIKGLPVRKVLVDEAAPIEAEIYLGITNDRNARRPVMISSSAGGVEIEEIARKTPEKIVKILIDPLLGLRDYQARDIAAGIDLNRECWRQFLQIAKGLWQVYKDCDATLAEINPLVVTTGQKLLALDGKMVIDDNALFRQQPLAEMRDLDIEAPSEIEARRYGLSFIKLDGNIGCMVNGAGLATTTMDILKLFGGSPANFLDIGGGASSDKVSAAMRIILTDRNVNAVLYNIFGGITRCDEVARGILAAIEEVKPNVPMVIRLVGTNAEEGRRILADANMITAETLVEAAEKAVAVAQRGELIMSILIDKNTRVLVQGMTGNEGLFHTEQMLLYGTNIVAGVTPGKGGEWVLDGKVPVFDSVRIAVDATGADASVIFVPARFAPDAIYEAADAGIPLVVCITEGIPVQDMMQVRVYLDATGSRLIGPNCPGLLTPGESKVGIIPGNISIPGSVGVVSRSGTLTYEVLYALMLKGIGVSTCVGIGGDPINGTNFIDCLALFEDDGLTETVVMIGEIGGTDEEKAAEFIQSKMTKKVVSFIAGQTAPPGKRMGHAGAIIEGGSGTADEKIAALKTAGVEVARHPEEIPTLLKAGI